MGTPPFETFRGFYDDDLKDLNFVPRESAAPRNPTTMVSTDWMTMSTDDRSDSSPGGSRPAATGNTNTNTSPRPSTGTGIIIDQLPDYAELEAATKAGIDPWRYARRQRILLRQRQGRGSGSGVGVSVGVGVTPHSSTPPRAHGHRVTKSCDINRRVLPIVKLIARHRKAQRHEEASKGDIQTLPNFMLDMELRLRVAARRERERTRALLAVENHDGFSSITKAEREEWDEICRRATGQVPRRSGLQDDLSADLKALMKKDAQMKEEMEDKEEEIEELGKVLEEFKVGKYAEDEMMITGDNAKCEDVDMD